MQQRNQENGLEGRLPAMAPLANPYVPFQLENPPVYEAQKGIVRGTLFPGLDLPFMGMINQKELPVTPLTELQTLAFAINEGMVSLYNIFTPQRLMSAFHHVAFALWKALPLGDP